MNGHRSDIKHRRLEKAAVNFFPLLSQSLENLVIFEIEKIHRDDTNYRKLKESFWIQMFGRLAPRGLNTYPLGNKKSKASQESCSTVEASPITAKKY